MGARLDGDAKRERVVGAVGDGEREPAQLCGDLRGADRLRGCEAESEVEGASDGVSTGSV